MAHFIYRPKSGDRVFAEREAVGLAFARWPNGCRHVIGGAAPLAYTGGSRDWRSAAHSAAKAFVAARGGIAWDDRGEISIIVPCEHAFEAARVMEALGGAFGHAGAHVTPTSPIGALLLGQGLATLTVEDGSNRLVLASLPQPAATPVGEAVHRFFEVEKYSTSPEGETVTAQVPKAEIVFGGGAGTIVVPATWWGNGPKVTGAVIPEGSPLANVSNASYGGCW